MIYTKECLDCGNYREICCSISQHEVQVKPVSRCPNCGGVERQVIEAPCEIRERTPFPKHGHEHVSYKPGFHSFRDRGHAREYLAERGLGSKFLDDGG